MVASISLLFLTGCSTFKPMTSYSENSDSNDGCTPIRGLIHFYQGPLNHLSSVKLGECGMEPSCSNYALQAMDKHGFLIGWFMTCDRLIRCGRDEMDLSPKVIAYGKYKCLDPVDANDDWLNGDPVNKNHLN